MASRFVGQYDVVLLRRIAEEGVRRGHQRTAWPPEAAVGVLDELKSLDGQVAMRVSELCAVSEARSREAVAASQRSAELLAIRERQLAEAELKCEQERALVDAATAYRHWMVAGDPSDPGTGLYDRLCETADAVLASRAGEPQV